MKWRALNKKSRRELLIERLADVKGVKNLEDWIKPKKSALNSPHKLPNVTEACEKIFDAVMCGRKITIMGDVDADGVSSFAIIYNYLKQFTDNINHIHAQRSSGHGLDTVMEEFTSENDKRNILLLDQSTHLLIIVDSSSNSVEACKIAKEKYGCDIIVLDHHEVDVENPYVTLVNNQLGYPNKELSGSAVVYKTCQVLDDYFKDEIKNGCRSSSHFKDLCMIGLIGDVMSMKEKENRYLVYDGFKNIKNIGLLTLLEEMKIDIDEISTTDIGFSISPVISACTRYDQIELVLELLTEEYDLERVRDLALKCIELNKKRKNEQQEIIKRIIDEERYIESEKLVIVTDDEIHSGFRGLIATELVERFKKPAFVVKRYETGELKGSARGLGSIKLKEICEKSGLFNFTAGHSQAFGVEFNEDKTEEIQKYFNDVIDDSDLEKTLYYDMEIDVTEIDYQDIVEVKAFSRISGKEAYPPKFLIKGLVVSEKENKKLGKYCRSVMGENRNAVKLICEDDYELVKFRTNEDYMSDVENDYNESFGQIAIECIGTIGINKWLNPRTRQTIITKQIMIEDYKHHELD